MPESEASFGAAQLQGWGSRIVCHIVWEEWRVRNQSLVAVLWACPKHGAPQHPQHQHLVIHALKDYMVEKNRKLKEQFAAAAQAGSEGV